MGFSLALRITMSVFFCLFLLVLPAIPGSGAYYLSERAALAALQAAVGGNTTSWNMSMVFTPCMWEGVVCGGDQDAVVGLRLSGFSLSGSIPPEIRNLTQLQTLNLTNNLLTGSLPSGLFNLFQLRSLYLNRNYFSGEIPFDLNQLVELRDLDLENNMFTGNLPNLVLPLLEHFNVSFNPLEGTVPESLQGQSAYSFLGTKLCDTPLRTCPSEGNHKLEVILQVLFGLMVSAAFVWGGIKFWDRFRNGGPNGAGNGGPNERANQQMPRGRPNERANRQMPRGPIGVRNDGPDGAGNGGPNERANPQMPRGPIGVRNDGPDGAGNGGPNDRANRQMPEIVIVENETPNSTPYFTPNSTPCLTPDQTWDCISF